MKVKEPRGVTVDGEFIPVERSSGNIYADLGIPNPEEHKMKARLVMEIDRLMKAQGLTQTQLAELAGTDQPKISKLLRGQFRDYSIDRLVRIVTRLGSRVELRIAPAREVRGGSERGRKKVARPRMSTKAKIAA